MNTPKLDQARIWAEEVGRLEGLRPGPRATVEVIQSLPDHWIDAKELRELKESLIDSVREMPGIAEQTTRDTIRELVYGYIEWIDDILPAPPLPTLAELVEQGNDPQSYQWTQAQVFPTATTLGAITSVDGYTRSAIILFTDGTAKNVPWAFITPLPDLPKLEWPGDGVVDAEIVDDEPVMLPRPEDVPSGKPWIVKFDGHEWVGTRDSRVETVCSWALARLDGADFTVSSDDEITLMTRLVPEVTP